MKHNMKKDRFMRIADDISDDFLSGAAVRNGLPGFRMTEKSDDSVVFSYIKDPDGVCIIIFGSDSSGFGYSVSFGIDDDIVYSCKEGYETAWNHLKSHLAKYTAKMDLFISEMKKSYSSEKSSEKSCSISKVVLRPDVERKIFSGQSLFDSVSGDDVYRILFDGADFSVISSVLEKLRTQFPAGIYPGSRSSVYFRISSGGDFRHIRSILSDFGFMIH